MLFKNRREAGIALGEEIKKQDLKDPIVIALPRGGVPVGYEIAQALNAPLEVLIVRKIGAPNHEELGVGAITEKGLEFLNRSLMNRLHITETDLKDTVERELVELQRRVLKFRGPRPFPSVKGRNVILVDDGLATGYTAIAGVKYLQQAGAEKIYVAVPVAASSTVTFLERAGVKVVCLQTPHPFMGIGMWYDDFRQLQDEEVIRILLNEQMVIVKGKGFQLPGTLTLPPDAMGWVVFAHGSGSSRLSPRNIQVAHQLNEAGIGTLLFDLLTPEENRNRNNVFDLSFLAKRLTAATEWARKNFPQTVDLPLGYFGASTGGGAALWAAADPHNDVTTVISRGGRPDLALPKLSQVNAPTLLIVGEEDQTVVGLNRKALRYLKHGQLVLIPHATHVFEEPGALEQVADLATQWFVQHFKASRAWVEKGIA